MAWWGGGRREGKRHTSAWAAKHEYHRHLVFLKNGFFGCALGSRRRCRCVILLLVGTREVEGISDLLYEVGSHRGPDQTSARARRAGGRLSGGVRMRVRWLRGGGRERSMRRRKRGRLQGRGLDSVHVLGSETTRLTYSTGVDQVWLGWGGPRSSIINGPPTRPWRTHPRRSGLRQRRRARSRCHWWRELRLRLAHCVCHHCFVHPCLYSL